jgi:hypothetical protein
MLIIDKTITNTLYLTLSELEAAPSVYYQFTITNRATKETASFIWENTSDVSYWQYFEVDGSDLEDYNTGLYSYEVKAVEDGDPVGDVLEYGYLDLRNGATFNPAGYSEQNNLFKVYNG